VWPAEYSERKCLYVSIVFFPAFLCAGSITLYYYYYYHYCYYLWRILRAGKCNISQLTRLGQSNVMPEDQEPCRIRDAVWISMVLCHKMKQETIQPMIYCWLIFYIYISLSVGIYFSVSISGVGAQGDSCTFLLSIVRPLLLYSAISPVHLTKYSILHNGILSQSPGSIKIFAFATKFEFG
jgi:hypothetical protein